MLLVVVLAPATGAVVSSSGSIVRVAAEADARVDESRPEKNFGKWYLRVNGGEEPTEQSYVRFVVGDVGEVRRATLRVFAYYETGDGPAVFTAANEWSEREVAWSTRPQVLAGPVADSGGIPAETWVEFDVSSVVRGAGTYTFALVPTSDDGANFNSKEMGSGPELALETRGASPTPPQDSEPPSAPADLAATDSTQTAITLTWSAATDNVAVTGYGMYRDGVGLESVAGTSFTFTDLTCGTRYTLGVDALDAAGNRSERAETVASTSACASDPPPADVEPPTKPANLTTTERTQTGISLSWSASADNVGVAGYVLLLGGSTVGSTTRTSHVFTSLACGTTYRLGVLAFDDAGNRSDPAELTTSTGSCSSEPPQTDVFYVSPNGADSNPGTLEKPWRTLGKAMAALSAGQKAFLRAGTYAEAMSGSCSSSYNALTWSRSGTASAPITIRGYPTEESQVVIKTKLKLTGSYLRLVGLVVDKNFSYSSFDNACTGEPNINVYGDDVEILRVEVRGSAMSGIYLSSADRARILRNWIHDNGTHQKFDHGIYYSSGSGGVIANNVISGGAGFGIQLYSGPSGQLVTQNTIVGAYMSGIVLDTSGGDIVIVSNIVAHNRQYGISYRRCSDCSADRNVAYGNGSGAMGGSFQSGLVIDADPQFLDRAGGNLRLRAGSPAIDGAVFGLSRPFDFDGLPRPQGAAPDIGAFER